MDIDPAQLRRFREFGGRSIRQLAREAGISHSHLAYIENGRRKAKEGVIKKLADALDVPIEDLISG